jgi:nucleotide-binding universal stress UspA family protein
MTAWMSGGTILCALDRDGRAPALIAAAHGWAAATGSRAVFVHVDGRSDDRKGDRAADAARAAFTAQGVGEAELRVTSGDPAAALSAEIAAIAPALVLVASAGDGAPGLGRVCRGLLRGGGPPVAIVPPAAGSPRSGRPVACAVSLGEHDEGAIRFADAFAAKSGRRLVLRSAVGVKEAAWFAAAQARAAAAVTHATTDTAVRAEALARRLLAAARDTDADALVMASRAGDRVSRVLEHGMFWRAAACAVIVVRA